MVALADSTKIWAATLASNGQSFWVAPLGTSLPANAYTALDVAFVDLGWMGDDGFTNSPKRTTKKVKAFGGATVKVLQTDYAETVKATCYETTPNVLKEVFGSSSVTVGSYSGHRTLAVVHSQAMLARRVFCVESVDGVKLRRLVLKEAQVTEIGDIHYTNTDVLKYTLTIDCFIPAGDTTAVAEYTYEPDVTPGS